MFKWAGAAAGLVLVSYLAMVGVGLAAGGQAPLTPWLPSNGAPAKGAKPHHAGKLAAKRAASTFGPQTLVRPVVDSKTSLGPIRPTTRPHPKPTGTYSGGQPILPPVTSPPSTRPTGPRPSK